MLLIIAISTFVCISLGVLGVYWLVYRPQSAATERLRRLGGKDGGATVNAQSFVLPDDSPIIYRAIQIATMAGFPLIVAGVCALLARPLSSAVVYIMLAFIAGFFLPRWILGRITKNRQRDLRWG